MVMDNKLIVTLIEFVFYAQMLVKLAIIRMLLNVQLATMANFYIKANA